MTASTPRKTMRTLLAGSLLAALLPLAAACTSVNPATGQEEFTLLSPADEARLGREEHAKIVTRFGGVYDDPEVGGYVAEVGGRIVANSELAGSSFTFTVLNTPVVNAFALPGGYVYLTRGLLALAGDEAQLAGVLAHEVGHVTARHTAQRMTRGTLVGLGAAVLGAAFGVPGELTNLGSELYLKSFSRDQEYEADLLGIRYLARAGYDPYAQSDFLQALADHDRLARRLAGEDGSGGRPPEFLSTHPRTAARVRRAIEAAAGSGVPPTAPRRRDAFLDRIDGLVYGDAPEQGFVRGRTFSHPGMGFTFTVPPGFRLINSEKAVYAKGPDRAVIVLDSKPTERPTDPLRYMVNGWARNVRLEGIERIDLNGMAAATATTRIVRPNQTVYVRLVAIEFSPRRLFRFQFVVPDRMTPQLEEELKRTTFSFRRLGPDEAARLKPLRLRVVTVRAGDTTASLAQRMAFEDFRIERFRTLNGLVPGEEPRPGTRVKIVVE